MENLTNALIQERFSALEGAHHAMLALSHPSSELQELDGHCVLLMAVFKDLKDECLASMSHAKQMLLNDTWNLSQELLELISKFSEDASAGALCWTEEQKIN